jgi:hypothetical protein
MTIKFEQMPVQGGLYWVAKDETGTARGAIAATYSSPSSGRPVGEKHLRNGLSVVTVRMYHPDGSDTVIADAQSREFKYRSDSDKWARAWIRQNDARAKLIAAITA